MNVPPADRRLLVRRSPGPTRSIRSGRLDEAPARTVADVETGRDSRFASRRPTRTARRALERPGAGGFFQ